MMRVASFRTYATSRCLGWWLPVTLIVTVVDVWWANHEVTTIVDSRVHVKGSVLIAVGLAVFAAWGCGRNFGMMEQTREGQMLQLRVVHASCLILTLGYLGLLVGCFTSLSAGVHFVTVALSALGLQLVGMHLVPSLPLWLLVALLMGVQFILGVDPTRHQFFAWAIWVSPSAFGVLLDGLVGVVGMSVWIWNGSYRLDADYV